MSNALRLSLLCTLALAAACGTVDDLPADGGSRKDGGFVLVEDPPVPDAGKPGTDGGAGTDGGNPDGGSPGCGNDQLDTGEGCDDGNQDAGDGCSASCLVETGFTCEGTPSTCTAVCGDGKRLGTEECDDGNPDAGDGCAPDCSLESGFACDGGPCAPECGDGQLTAPEACDDGNTTPGDGCSAICTKEPGFTCTSAGCDPKCGDGLAVGTETCDDGDLDDGDGCDSACDLEPGYTCAGTPSVCAGTCGDGLVVATEGCDDGAKVPGDGCSATCAVEAGYDCSSPPCATVCGDGTIAGSEACDDGNGGPGDGCDDDCQVEDGFACTGTGAVSCKPVCGDMFVVAPLEGCDDGNSIQGDGCKGCSVEPGFTCSGAPSVCVTDCGDGIVAGAETCDPDAGTQPTHGCSPGCTLLGGLQVTLAGAPAGTKVKLTGPSGETSTVSSGALLGGLDAGTYTLEGTASYRDGGVVDTVLDAPAPLQVTVTGGAKATATLAWTERGGTGTLWLGSSGNGLLGIQDAPLSTLGAGLCTNSTQCSGGTVCLPAGYCARSFAGGADSLRAVVALADGTLVFGGIGAGAPRIVTYAPAELAKASPASAQPAITSLGTLEIRALAASPGGAVFAAAGTSVYALPKPLGAGAATKLVTDPNAGSVLALAVTFDPDTPGSELLWVAARTTSATPTTTVKGYPLAGGTPVATLAVSDGTSLPAGFGAQVALAVAPDGQALWVADGLSSPSQVRLKSYAPKSDASAPLDASLTLLVNGYEAPTGLAVGNVTDVPNPADPADPTLARQASPLLLADDSGKLLLLPAEQVAFLSDEEAFTSLRAWTAGAPGGLAFSPPRRP